jgi:hypothetical protein
MSDQLIAKPLPSQDNTTWTDEDKHPCLKQDSNPRSSVQALKASTSDCMATGSAVDRLKSLLLSACVMLYSFTVYCKLTILNLTLPADLLNTRILYEYIHFKSSVTVRLKVVGRYG